MIKPQYYNDPKSVSFSQMSEKRRLKYLESFGKLCAPLRKVDDAKDGCERMELCKEEKTPRRGRPPRMCGCLAEKERLPGS